MSRVVGIDPGTLSFDLCGLDNGRVFLDTSITSPEIAATPKILVDALKQAQPLDLVIGPSGYGLPWVRAKDLSDDDLFLLALADEREQGQPLLAHDEVQQSLGHAGYDAAQDDDRCTVADALLADQFAQPDGEKGAGGHGDQDGHGR